MFNLFDIAKTEKQICQLHINNLECLEIHNQIRSDVFEFKVELNRMRYPGIDFQVEISRAYKEVITHNTEMNNRIKSTIKYLKNHATRL